MDDDIYVRLTIERNNRKLPQWIRPIVGYVFKV